MTEDNSNNKIIGVAVKEYTGVASDQIEQVHYAVNEKSMINTIAESRARFSKCDS